MNAAAALLLAALDDGPARPWAGKSTQRGWVVPSYLQARIREAVDDETEAIVIDVANRRPRALQDVEDARVRRMVRGTLVTVREASDIRAKLSAPVAEPELEDAEEEPETDAEEESPEEPSPV